MSIWNVVAIQRVSVFNAERTESTVIDRVIAEKTNVVALDEMVRVTKVAE